MSLRAKLLFLWGGLAVAPLLAIGVFEYFHSVRTVRTLIASQVQAISDRAALELGDGYSRRISDLLLIAENAETQRLYEAYARVTQMAWPKPGLRPKPISVKAGNCSATSTTGSNSGTRRMRLSSDSDQVQHLPEREPRAGPAGITPTTVLVQPVMASGRGEGIRKGRGADLPGPHPAAGILEVTFGRAGYSTVIDRGTGRVLFHPRQGVRGGLASALLGPSGWRWIPNSSSRNGAASPSGKLTPRESPLSPA